MPTRHAPAQLPYLPAAPARREASPRALALYARESVQRLFDMCWRHFLTEIGALKRGYYENCLFLTMYCSFLNTAMADAQKSDTFTMGPQLLASNLGGGAGMNTDTTKALCKNFMMRFAQGSAQATELFCSWLRNRWQQPPRQSPQPYLQCPHQFGGDSDRTM